MMLSWAKAKDGGYNYNNKAVRGIVGSFGLLASSDLEGFVRTVLLAEPF